MRFTLLSEKWRLILNPKLRKNAALCRIDTRVIEVDDKCTDRQFMDRVIHETLHAANWHADEQWVNTTARDLERLLFRLGYRRDKSLSEL